MPGLCEVQTISNFVSLVELSKQFIEHFEPAKMKSTTSSELSYKDGAADTDCIDIKSHH